MNGSGDVRHPQIIRFIASFFYFILAVAADIQKSCSLKPQHHKLVSIRSATAFTTPRSTMMMMTARGCGRGFILSRRKRSWKLPFLLPQPCGRKDTLKLWSSRGGSQPDNDHQHLDTRNTPASDRRIITYLTDVEGDGAYLDRYVRQSRVLTFREVSPRLSQHGDDNDGPGGYFPYTHCIDFTDDNAVLVFGGDVWDKGGSDLYVIRQLLDLHRRYGPERVYWCFGNRDTNKMRILQEMGMSQQPKREGNDHDHGTLPTQQTLPHHNGVYWKRPVSGNSAAGVLNTANVVPDDAGQRLQWILASTMGSPRAFELRRQELERERIIDRRRSSDTEVTDDDVVESYRQSCHPRGELGQYLSKGHLIIRMGQVVFLHGALPITRDLLQQQVAATEPTTSSVWQDLRFAMPWERLVTTTSEEPIPTVHEWIVLLNQFARNCVSHWNEYVHAREHATTAKPTTQDEPIWSTVGGYDTTNPSAFTNLIQYAQASLPGGANNPTIVYSSFCPQGSMPSRFFPNPPDPLDRAYYRLVQDFFQESGVRLMICGHQPQGDTLSPIRIESNGPREGHDDPNSFADDKHPSNWILCCDTSYSGDTLWRNSSSDQVRTNLGIDNGPSFRGDHAVCEVLIEQCLPSGAILNVRYHGILSDGSRYETQLPLNDDTNETDWTGTLAPSSWVSSQVESPTQGESEYWWVKAKLGNDNKYLITTSRGYDVSNSIVSLPKK